MKAAALAALCMGAVSAAAGLAVTALAFAPIPFADSIDFFTHFTDTGGWEGYGLRELYTRHNEHRLVLPRLWFLLDMAAFDATQTFLIAVTVVSALVHAVILVLLFRALGHRGWALCAFAGAALGAALSPAQWENLVWGFQVQFVQVWLFASLAFIAVAHAAAGRSVWHLVLAGVLAGLASTYSMANGLLVWPLLVALALWAGVRRGPLVLLIAAAAAVVAFEVSSFHAHPGHGDPMQTIAEPVRLLRYAFRYLGNAIGAIGSLGQEIVGGLLFAAVLGMAVDAVLRRQRYTPVHAILLAIAGFVIGAALATALGRVTLGLGQANAARYATPSFLFLLATGALLLDRLLRVESARLRVGGSVLGVAILLVPGLVDGIKHLPEALGERDARINAVVVYLAGGYRPASLQALFPFAPSRPFRVLDWFQQEELGPFADRRRFLPPPSALDDAGMPPRERCRGHVDSAASDPVVGVEVSGWAAAVHSAAQPEWIVVTDRTDRTVGWGASRVRRDDVGAALGIGWRGRGFTAAGHEAAVGPLTVAAVFGDGRRCLLEAAITPRSEFLSALPADAVPASDAGWTVTAGADTGRTGPDPVPDAVRPAIGTLDGDPRLAAHVDLVVPAGPWALAVPVRTGAFPSAAVLLVRRAASGEEIARHDFTRPSDGGWTWRVFTGTVDPRLGGRVLRVEVRAAGRQPVAGIAVGRPYWIPAGGGG